MAVPILMTNMNPLLLEIGKMSKTGIKVKLVGQDGNVFNLIGICTTALRRNGMRDKVAEFQKEVMSSHSYEEALCVMMDWFEVS